MATDALLPPLPTQVDPAANGAAAVPPIREPQTETTTTTTPLLDHQLQQDDADNSNVLRVVKRIDFAPLAAASTDTDALPGGANATNDELLHDADLKIDIAADMSVVVGFKRALYVTRDTNNDSNTAAATLASPSERLAASLQRTTSATIAAAPAAMRVDLQTLQLLDAGRALQLDDDDDDAGSDDSDNDDAYDYITDVKWIGNDYICASYTSGVVRLFARATQTLVFEQKFHNAAITKLDVSRSATTTSSSSSAATATATSTARHTTHTTEQQQQPPQRPTTNTFDAIDSELWILFADSTLAIVHVAELVATIAAAYNSRPAQASKFRKLALRDQTHVLSAVACGAVRPSLFQSHPRLGVVTILSAGSDPFLTFYHAGNDQNSIIHLAHIASAIATKAAGAVWSFAKSWGWRSAAATSPNDADDSSNAIDDAAAHVAAPVSSVRTVADDMRRQSRCLALSPTGRLAAVTDSLGRVLLIDTSRMLVIRMWKGYRNAQVGWMHCSEQTRHAKNNNKKTKKSKRVGLYLVIYSVQRGFVEVWRARFGPRVFSFAVGAHARVFTIASGITTKTRCVVLAFASSSSPTTTAELLALDAQLPNVTVLLKYFTQNKLQEETFVLHQITAALYRIVKQQQFALPARGEQDGALAPLLDQMATLASTSTIDALLELVTSNDMALLRPVYVHRALEQLQLALKRAIASHSPTGAELSLLWKTQWQLCIVAAFIRLQAEFERSQHVAASSIEVPTAMFATHHPTKDTTPTPLDRLVPWLELYRRAGVALDDDVICSQTRDALQRAARVTTWAFLELFSMPFSDASLPRRRDVLALYEQQQQDDDKRHSNSSAAFLDAVLHLLRVPVLRPLVNASQRRMLLAFAFTPILASVFAVQELQTLHASVLWRMETHTSLFLEWFFALPLGTVLALPPPSASSSLQRWLEPYFAANDDLIDDVDALTLSSSSRNDGQSLDTTASTAVRKLSPCSAPLAELFTACWTTPKLFHAFVLAVHCSVGEQQRAKRREEATLGQVSAAGSGVRWLILQDALATTVHLALRLGRMNRLTVEAVENVDEILRALALMQLNDSCSATATAEQAASNNLTASTTTDALAASATSNAADDWVATIEHCRSSAEMRAWRPVLASFPQFADDDDALRCFRVMLLCAAWNAERSDMHQLDDALIELEAVGSSRLRAAMATHVWETFIRVHVVTLVSFWEESAAGKKPQRGLQPQIARRFFAIIQALLQILVDAVVTAERTAAATRAAAAVVHDDGDNDESDDESDDGSDSNAADDDLEEDEGDSDSADNRSRRRGRRTRAFRMRALPQRRTWPCGVTHLRAAFRQHWPPAHSASQLLQTLARFRVSDVSLAQVADHKSLVLLLDSFAATRVTPVSIVQLFAHSGRHLCRPHSFLIGESMPPIASVQSLAPARTQFLKQLLRFDDSLGVALAEAFGLSVDMIREEHVLFLYQSGRDDVADHSLEQMAKQPPPVRLGLQLAAIARARLALVLQRMAAETEFVMLMSVLPADVFAWVISETQPPLIADVHVRTLDKAPSLTSTHYLLLKCLSIVPPHGPEFAKISAMSVLVKDIIAQVKQQHPTLGK